MFFFVFFSFHVQSIEWTLSTLIFSLHCCCCQSMIASKKNKNSIAMQCVFCFGICLLDAKQKQNSIQFDLKSLDRWTITESKWFCFFRKKWWWSSSSFDLRTRKFFKFFSNYCPKKKKFRKLIHQRIRRKEFKMIIHGQTNQFWSCVCVCGFCLFYSISIKINRQISTRYIFIYLRRRSRKIPNSSSSTAFILSNGMSLQNYCCWSFVWVFLWTFSPTFLPNEWFFSISK